MHIKAVNNTFRANGYAYHAEHRSGGIMDIYEGPAFVLALPANTPPAQVLQALNGGGATTVVVDRGYGGPSLGQCVAEGAASGIGFGFGAAVANSLFGHGHSHETVIHETVVIDDRCFFDD